MKIKLLHLHDILKVINNGSYSFSISHFVLKLFRFVWYVNEINYDVKLCTDYCKLLENRVYLRDYWTKSLKILLLNVSQHTDIKQDQLSFIKPEDIHDFPIKYNDLYITLSHS